MDEFPAQVNNTIVMINGVTQVVFGYLDERVGLLVSDDTLLTQNGHTVSSAEQIAAFDDVEISDDDESMFSYVFRVQSSGISRVESLHGYWMLPDHCYDTCDMAFAIADGLQQKLMVRTGE